MGCLNGIGRATPRAMRPFDDIARIERAQALDKPAAAVRAVVTRVLRNRTVKDALHGVWLGHPLHPGAAQFTAGSLLSASMLDAVGGPVGGGRRPSSFLIAAGLATAPVTVAAGWADWSESHEDQMRVGSRARCVQRRRDLALRRGARPAGPRRAAVGCCRWPAGRSPAPARCSAVTWATGRRSARTTARSRARRPGELAVARPAGRAAGRQAGQASGRRRAGVRAAPGRHGRRRTRRHQRPVRPLPAPVGPAARGRRRRRRRRGAHRVPVARQRVPGGRRLRRARPGDGAGARGSSRGWWATSCRRGSSRSPECRRASAPSSDVGRVIGGSRCSSGKAEEGPRTGRTRAVRQRSRRAAGPPRTG